MHRAIERYADELDWALTCEDGRSRCEPDDCCHNQKIFELVQAAQKQEQGVKRKAGETSGEENRQTNQDDEEEARFALE
jgi:hypothetical protein